MQLRTTCAEYAGLIVVALRFKSEFSRFKKHSSKRLAITDLVTKTVGSFSTLNVSFAYHQCRLEAHLQQVDLACTSLDFQ